MRWLAYLGKFLISVGVGVLLFVGWTLWGTGIYTRQQQNDLSQQFDRLPVIEVDRTAGSPYAGPDDSFDPGPGDPVFRLTIPRIDKRYVVVEGVDTEALTKGPGHYPECRPGFPRPLCTEFPEMYPGEEGRVVVSGHRTTYDAPFYDLDKLRPGDELETETQWGDFTYEVVRTEVVPSSSLAIVIPTDKAELVLTTCNPKYSAAERLIVYAEMVT